MVVVARNLCQLLNFTMFRVLPSPRPKPLRRDLGQRQILRQGKDSSVRFDTEMF